MLGTIPFVPGSPGVWMLRHVAAGSQMLLARLFCRIHEARVDYATVKVGQADC